MVCPQKRHKGAFTNVRQMGVKSIERNIVYGVEAPVLPVIDSIEDLQEEKKWISGIVALWLDEEWTPLEVHKDLGMAAAEAYGTARAMGQQDMSDVLLAMSSELLKFNYRETFTDAFEVSNKVVEMLMMRAGHDVCCTSREDQERIARYEDLVKEEGRKAS